MNLVIPTAKEGLELRFLTEPDADAFFQVTDKNRPNLRMWLRWVDDHTTADITRAFIRLNSARFEKQQGLELGIWYKGQWAGAIGFHDWNKVDRKAAVGYWLAEEYQGNGVMTCALRALMKYGFEKMGLNRIEIRCAVENAKSRAVPERLNLTNEGVCRQAQRLHHRFIDLVVYSLLKSEWKEWK